MFAVVWQKHLEKEGKHLIQELEIRGISTIFSTKKRIKKQIKEISKIGKINLRICVVEHGFDVINFKSNVISYYQSIEALLDSLDLEYKHNITETSEENVITTEKHYKRIDELQKYNNNEVTRRRNAERVILFVLKYSMEIEPKYRRIMNLYLNSPYKEFIPE